MAESIPGIVARRVGEGRVGLATLLSDGLYLFYWFYLSWKHLGEVRSADSAGQSPSGETGRRYYPVWHSLAVLVPLLNLYITYVHLKAIRGLLVAEGMETALSPVRGVVLMGVGNVARVQASLLGQASLGPAVLLDLVGIALFAYLMLWGQSSLNRYWGERYGERLRRAPMGRGEVLVVLLGLGSWALYFLMWRGILPAG